MKALNPREATLRNQFRQKLVDSSRNVFSEADLLQLAVELRLEQGFPRSLSERNFVRRIIQDVIELALLKRMFNLAIDWDLYIGSNPVRKVKFFQEINLGFRVLTTH
jgi:hypothetical protein